MRLIDADALIERLDDFNKWCKDERLQGSLFAVDVVGDMPTVDVLEQIRAEIDVARFIDKDTKLCKNANASGLEEAMQIIDKYR